MTILRMAVIASLATGLLAAAPAHAGIYDYTLSGGPGITTYGVGSAPGQGTYSADLKIDTTAGTGTLIGDGGAVNVSFTGNFAGFAGGANPLVTYSVVIDPSSSITYGGHTYGLLNTAPAHVNMIQFQGSSINLWAEWTAAGCPSCSLLGDTTGNISSSTSSGGTAVPEPGMVGLMGLGAAALVWRRRKALAIA